MLTNKDIEKLKETFATKEDVCGIKEDVCGIKEDLKRFATKQELKGFKEEILRHFDVVAEDIVNTTKLAMEQISANSEKLNNHEDRIEKLEALKTDVSILKTKMTAVEAKVG